MLLAIVLMLTFWKDLTMKIDILTLFPEMFSPLEHSIVGKATEKGLLEINYHNFRENAEKARHVDDEPYGGGQGMLLRAQPIFDTIDKIDAKKPRVILWTQQGVNSIKATLKN